jgi:predicted HTH domain antitoxin
MSRLPCRSRSSDGWAGGGILTLVQITVELAEDIARHPDPGREALEALAIEGYGSGALTHYQASQLLGFSRFEFEDFLMARNIFDHAYGMDDLEGDLATLDKLRRASSGDDPGRRRYDAAQISG